MAISDYVEQILSSPVYVFDGLIEQIMGRTLHFSKIELARHNMKIDSILVESIKSILKDLQKEEGVISHFLYSKFGFEIRKNKRRKQLIYLGSELKIQHKKIKLRCYGIYRQKERLAYTIIDLKRLSENFEMKDMLFESDTVKNKSQFYIDELNCKIEELQKIQLSLLMKYDNLCEVEKIYEKLFKSIPRYQFLQDETYLLLPRSVKA